MCTHSQCNQVYINFSPAAETSRLGGSGARGMLLSLSLSLSLHGITMRLANCKNVRRAILFFLSHCLATGCTQLHGEVKNEKGRERERERERKKERKQSCVAPRETVELFPGAGCKSGLQRKWRLLHKEHITCDIRLMAKWKKSTRRVRSEREREREGELKREEEREREREK